MRRLMRLKAKEISLTRAAANRRVFALYKSAKGGPMSEPTAEELRQQVRKAVQDVDPAIVDKLDEIVAKAEQSGERELSARAAGVIKAIGRLLAPHAAEIKSSDIMEACKAAGLDKPMPAEMGKSAADDEDEDEEDVVVDGDDDSEDDEDEEDEEEEQEEEDEADDEKAKKSANVVPASDLTQHKKAAPSAESAKAITQEPKGGSVAKAAQAPVEKAADFEEMRKHNKELAGQVEELRKHIREQDDLRKAEADARELADMKKSVKENYGHLALDADLVAPALKSLRDLEDQAHYNAMIEVLNKSADYRRRMEGPSGLFKSYGHSRPGAPVVSAAEELDELVKSEASKPEHAGKSQQQVYRDVARTARGSELKKRASLEARGEI